MKFEELPEGSEYRYQIALDEGLELEILGAYFREYVVRLAATGHGEQIREHELEFSMLTADGPNGILTNKPEELAGMFEDFQRRTGEAIIILAQNAQVPFESNAIARRVKLGAAAENLAGLIRGEYGADELVRQLDQHGPELFIKNSKHPEV